MTFDLVVEYAGKTLDVIGIAIILFGTLVALATYALRSLEKAERGAAYRHARLQVGRAIVLGLEFLVAGDIIRTVATLPSLRNVGALALIVLIRTFLSIAIQVEVEHRWPWQREVTAPGTPHP